MAPHSSTLAWQIPWMEDCKEIPPVYHKGKQSWIFTGRTDAEIPILWLPHAKSWLIWKDPDAGRDWGQEEKGTTEDEMAGWHHQLDGYEWEWWWTGRPGVLRFMGLQRVGHDWAIELNWTDMIAIHCGFNFQSLMINNVSYLFMSLLAICISSLKKCLIRSPAQFSI